MPATSKGRGAGARVFGGTPVGGANDRYARPDNVLGDGTFTSPWTLTQALANAAPGQTVYLRGGTYSTTSEWVYNLQGTSGSPITFRSFPEEWARLEQVNNNDGGSNYYGVVNMRAGSAFPIFRDMELFNSNTLRVLNYNTNSSFRLGGVEMRSKGAVVRNLVIHDTGDGIANWSQTADGGANSETYGCLVYNNGWTDTARQNGLAIYMQNVAPAIKTIKHNIFAHPFAGGTKAGTDGNRIENFRYTENVVLSPAVDGILIYSGTFKIVDWREEGNRVWMTDNAAAWKHYYGDTGATDLTLINEFLSSKTYPVINEKPVTTLSMNGCTLHLRQVSGGVRVYAENGFTPGGRSFNNNAYHGGAPGGNNFQTMPGPTDHNTFASFKTATGQDAASTYTTAAPADRTWVDVNTYETGRANITVFNGNALSATVNVNVDSVLSTGQAWWLYNATNPMAGAIASGTYTSGVGIDVPMTTAVAGNPATRIGGTTPTTTLPDFGAFVLRRVGPTWVAPPTSLAL